MLVAHGAFQQQSRILVFTRTAVDKQRFNSLFLHEQRGFNDDDKDTKNIQSNTSSAKSRVELRIGGEGEQSGGLNGQLNESQEDTLAFIRDHEGYNTTKIAEALNKPFRTIDKHINALLKAGLIERRGSKKTGGYYLVGAEG